MIQSAFTYSRTLLRAFVTGVTAENQRFSNQHLQQQASKQRLHLISAVAGFSKSINPTVHQTKWSYGEDAYFIANHRATYVLGVADGVGGWREYGVDPSQVPRTIMSLCARLVDNGKFSASSPEQLLEHAYDEASMHKDAAMGSTTACLVSFDTNDKRLHTVNLGDSGYMVVRNGRVLARSQEQQHYFNTPFQLTLVPPSYRGRVLSDSPSEAVRESIDVLEGDIILVATDGLFDNMTDSMILRHLRIVKHRQRETIQSAANKIAHEAQKLSNDPEYMSPFCVAAAHNGYHIKGGKPDDITVLIATVNIGELGEFTLS